MIDVAATRVRRRRSTSGKRSVWRFNHYRIPGPRQPTNQRMSAAMFTVFEAGGSVEVDTATAIRVEVGGRVVSYWPYRPLAENAALVVAHQAGHAVDNL